MYEHPDLAKNAVEVLLGKIEKNYESVMSKSIKLRKQLSVREHIVVADFLAALSGRVPESREAAQEPIKSIVEWRRALEEQFLNGRTTPDTLKWEKHVDNAFVENLLHLLDYNPFIPMSFVFICIPDIFHDSEDSPLHFITCDNPVTNYDFTQMNSHYGQSWASKSLEVLVPLSPQIAVFCNNIGASGYFEVEYNFVHEVNNRIYRQHKYLMSKFPISSKLIDRITTQDRQSYLLKCDPSYLETLRPSERTHGVRPED